MSELTLTAMRLGLLAALWLFVLSLIGVLRSDIYGTKVSRRAQRKAAKRRAARPAPAPVAYAPTPMPTQAPAQSRKAAKRARRIPTMLVVTEGPLAGTSLPLRSTGLLIGRNPECALVLDDDYASGRHCRIAQGPDGWYVEDLGSTNGTFLGRQKLTSPQPLEIGSTLRIGKTVLELRG